MLVIHIEQRCALPRSQRIDALLDFTLPMTDFELMPV